jgi:hypothetical protein
MHQRKSSLRVKPSGISYLWVIQLKWSLIILVELACLLTPHTILIVSHHQLIFHHPHTPMQNRHSDPEFRPLARCESAKLIHLIDIPKPPRRPNAIQSPINDKADRETQRKSKVVEIRASRRNIHPRRNGLHKPRQKVAPAHDPSRKAPPVDAVPEVINPLLPPMIQIRQLHPPPPNNPIIANHNPRHRPQEYTIRRQHTDERRRGGEELPRAEGDADDQADVSSAADVDVAWEEAGDVHAGREGVVDGVDGELGGDEAAAGEEGGGARFGRVGGVEPLLDDVGWVPGRFVSEGV